MNWSEMRKVFNQLPSEELVTMLKGLHDLSPQNKAWLQNQLSPMPSVEFLEACRKKVADLIYKPTRSFPPSPRFRDARKVISEYKKSTRDLPGTLDLMLTYVERGHAFTNDFGDIDEPFYEALCNMLGKFADGLKDHPAAAALYRELFRDRLLKMNRTAEIGWGYGDFVHDTVGDLEQEFSESPKITR
jgi:hypothetical protein